MKKAFGLLIILLMVLSIFSNFTQVGVCQSSSPDGQHLLSIEPPIIEWSKTYGGTSQDEAFSVSQTSEGGYIVAGYGTSEWLALLVKTDSDGNMEWNKTFNGEAGNAFARSVQQTVDRGYMVVGSTGENVLLVKTDSDGSTIWRITYDGPLSQDLDQAYAVDQTVDEGYIVAGFTHHHLVPGYNDVLLVKTDRDGNIQWNKTYDWGSTDDRAYSVEQTLDDGYILAGSTTAGDSDNALLVKTDPDGNIQWSKFYKGLGLDYARSVQQTVDGGYIVAGYTGSFVVTNYDAWLIKTDSDGNIQWSKTYDKGSTLERAYSVRMTNDGGYIVAGHTYLNYYDAWVIKTDPDGNIQWDQIYGGTSDDHAYDVQETVDGGYIVAGSTYSFGAGSYDFWLIKLARHFVPDFEISVSPSSHIADPNEPASYTVTVTSLHGFNSPVSLSGIVDSNDLSLSFNPQIVIPASGGSTHSIMTVSVVSTALATHTITITGTSGEIVHSKIVSLNVPFLSVPYYSQGDTTWCAVSSVAMIMKFYGIYVHPWDVARGLLQGHNTPTHILLGDPLKIVVYLSGAGLSPELDIVDLARIKEKLDNKEPVVLAVTTLQHAVAITGYLDVDGSTVLFVNDPSGVLVDKLYPGEYPPPYVQNRVEWNDLEPYIGLGDWIIGVGGNAKPPMGTINVVGGGDYLDTWDHSIIVNHPPDHPGSDVYIWMSGYVPPGSSDTAGLTWRNAPTHPKSLDPEDLLSINIESEGAEWHRVVVNPTGAAQTYLFEIVFSKEGQVKWEKEYYVTVPALNWSDPIPSHIGLGDILNESGTYTIEFFLSNPDGSTLYDKVELPPIEYTQVLSVSCESPVNLYVVDPEGNAIGVDPETGEIVNEILDAVYSGPGTEPQIIRIPNPLDGDYVILMVGTAAGTYLATLELTTSQETITQTYSGYLEEGEVLESLAIVFENDMTSTPPLPAISVNKIFKPNEVSTKRKGAVMSRTNITNTGYLNIDEITYEDQILDGWTLKDFDHTISVTLFIDNVKYKIPYEELTYVATEDNTYVVYINFTDGVDLYQYDPELEQEAYVMTIYAFETGWVLEIKYPMHPPTDLLRGDYEATVSTTIVTPEGISLSVDDSARLHVF